MSARRLWWRGFGVFSLVSLVYVLWGVTPALATRNHIFSGSIGSPGSGPGQLSSPESVAVDNSSGPAAGDVYVADTGNARVDQFDPSGQFVRAWGWGVADGKEEFEICTTTCQAGIRPAEPEHSRPGQFDVPQYVAVDGSSGPSAGDVYVADDGTGLVQKFTSSGELVALWGNNGPGETSNGQLNGSNAIPIPTGFGGMVEGPFHTPFNGIAVGGSGGLWVFDRKDFMFEFDQSGAFTTSWYSQVAGHPPGIAADNADDLYLNGSFEQIEEFGSTGANLGILTASSQLEEGGIRPTGLAVDPIDNELYVDANGSSIERIASSCGNRPRICPVAETFGSQELTGAAGLAVLSAGETVYVAEPATGTVDTYALEPAGAPRIEDQTVSFVTSGSATLGAAIDPKDLSTEYRFEFGATMSYGESLPVPDGGLGAVDFETHEVSVHPQDLLAHTIYHYRVVARNSDGTTYGEDQTFTTQISGSALGLPDGRMYELVTPAAKEGALIFGPNWGRLQNGAKALTGQASADGRAIVDLASLPTEAEPLGNAMEVSVLSTRGSSGWSSQVIAPPHEEATFISINNGGEYRFFSEDLSLGIVYPFGQFTPLAPGATESTPYLRTDFVNGNPEEHCQSSCFQPLVTASNTPAGTVFGEALPNGACPRISCGPHFVDATPDLSHVILSSPAQLTSVPTPGGGLYEWSGDRLQLISAPPEGRSGVLRLAGTNALEAILEGTTPLAPGEYDARHAISDDGKRVVLVGNGLYLRDVATGELVRLDVPQGGSAASERPAYMTASTDASRIFFLDNAGLTRESSASGTDLYEYDLNAPQGSRLTDLTVGEHTGEAANVRSVLGASNDGSNVYFMAAGALTSNALSGECIQHSGSLLPENREACNIYVRHDGVTKLVTGKWNPERSGEESARVSPDGGWLAFMSSRDLTGYDTRDAISGHPDQEVYLYDTSTTRLVCASCNPTGARPVGVEENSGLNLTAGSLPRRVWAASNVPPLTNYNGEKESRYQPRYLSDTGRLFFDSNDALVPQDVNGTQDVYEYEPAGIGTCSASSVTFGVRSNGCVSLISSGASAEESAFMDASETGGDAFFITSSKLVSQDFDNAPDVYDAHECTVSVPCYPVAPAVPPACSTGDSCKAAPSPQPAIFGSAPSATFSGAGNVVPSSPVSGVKSRSLTRAQKLVQALRACRKRGGRRRAVCERTARKRYGPVGKSHKASAKRKGRG